jgi:hypothetical protein
MASLAFLGPRNRVELPPVPKPVMVEVVTVMKQVQGNRRAIREEELRSREKFRASQLEARRQIYEIWQRLKAVKDWPWGEGTHDSREFNSPMKDTGDQSSNRRRTRKPGRRPTMLEGG